jgi:hypothetical protein
VRVTLHPDEDRAVIAIGPDHGPTTVKLFVQRAELVVLRDTLTAAVTDLNTARHHPTSGDDDTTHRGDATPDEVDTPAA